MKVLIVGLGSIAKKHISALNNLRGDLEIYALRHNKEISNIEDGIINVLEPISDADFAIISNPTALHASTIRQLIKFNYPLFIEKPLFENLDQKDVLKEINSRKIPTYVACNLRFLDCIKFLYDTIKTKRINEVNVYCGSYLPDWRPELDFRKIYSANKELGGGVHIDLIHEIDYVYYLFGQPNVVKKTFSNKSSLDISAYDYANYLLEYNFFSTNIVLNYYRRNPKRHIEIVCEDGELFANLLTNEISWNGDMIFKSQNTIQDTYVAQMKYFIENIKDCRSKFNDINEAYNVLKICLEN